jgi:sugar phosphate isomerase/epimerase
MHLISRRQFFHQGSAAATAVLLSSFPRHLRADTLRLPIGIQLYTVGQALQKDVNGTLKQVRAIGYTQVETAGFAGLTAKQFRNALDEAGLTCHSCHLPMDSPDLGPVFEGAHIVGAHYAVSSVLPPTVEPGEKKTTTPAIDDYKNLAARMNNLGQKAKQANLRYAYHNHNIEFQDLGNGKIAYDVLLKETDPTLVDFELDCGWMIAAGYNPIQYFRQYPHRYKMIHIKDFVAGSKISTSLAKDLRPQGTELGRGYIDYKPILVAAQKAGIEYYYVEQEPPFLNMTSLEAAKVDYDYLRAL